MRGCGNDVWVAAAAAQATLIRVLRRGALRVSLVDLRVSDVERDCTRGETLGARAHQYARYDRDKSEIARQV